MKNTLFAALVAVGITISSGAFAAGATLYGEVNAFVNNNAGTTDATDVSLFDSYFGVRASEDLGNGTAAFINMAVNLSDDPNATDGRTATMRDAYVGLSSTTFGTIKAGTMNNLVKGINDTYVDKFNGFDVNSAYSLKIDNTVAYIAPTMVTGLTLAGAMVADNTTGKDGSDAYELMANMDYGIAETGIAYHKNQVTDAWVTLFGAKATYDNYGVGLAYELIDENDGTDKISNWYVDGSYTMGNNTFVIGYNVNEEANDLTTLEAVHSFSQRTSAYVNYQHEDKDTTANTENRYGVGLIHKF